MADPVPVSDLPTLSLLYKLGRITPADDLEPAYPPNANYNDKISVIKRDITTLAIDSIVNAANTSLLGGGGVDGAIHAAAGPGLYDECEELNGCETGSAKITDGYELPAKKVIHAVGPVYWAKKGQGKPAELLAGCYRTSLELAVENQLKSIAFSALSTGVYGYPSKEASEVALETVRKFLEEGKGEDLERIVFCNFLQKDEDAYYKNVSKYFPPAATAESTTKDKGTSTDATQLAAKLPNPPATAPKEAGESPSKKQKTEPTTDDEFDIVDREEAQGADA
ncbi:MACRO domain-containing protein 1 [Massarina eburnea CBS 473.64]|uniref:MACRO domain-containing protein 1 n=1 Tax=Massarina eburnea CBS 473.64 TaxID=1395130 RepID=A0A6A6RJQ5_9PLEO|nr:MACRO domain-containing protein 1 [Massarina eburnea CBS 473.64]